MCRNFLDWQRRSATQPAFPQSPRQCGGPQNWSSRASCSMRRWPCLARANGCNPSYPQCSIRLAHVGGREVAYSRSERLQATVLEEKGCEMAHRGRLSATTEYHKTAMVRFRSTDSASPDPRGRWSVPRNTTKCVERHRERGGTRERSSPDQKVAWTNHAHHDTTEPLDKPRIVARF